MRQRIFRTPHPISMISSALNNDRGVYICNCNKHTRETIVYTTTKETQQNQGWYTPLGYIVTIASSNKYLMRYGHSLFSLMRTIKYNRTNNDRPCRHQYVPTWMIYSWLHPTWLMTILPIQHTARKSIRSYTTLTQEVSRSHASQWLWESIYLIRYIHALSLRWEINTHAHRNR